MDLSFSLKTQVVLCLFGFFKHWLCGAAEGIITLVDAYLPRCQSIKLP